MFVRDGFSLNLRVISIPLRGPSFLAKRYLLLGFSSGLPFGPKLSSNVLLLNRALKGLRIAKKKNYIF